MTAYNGSINIDQFTSNDPEQQEETQSENTDKSSNDDNENKDN